MAITLDELKRMVFPGESGGDYNALFGYANRDGGQFANTRLTDMTVDQALAFANPSGPYGQSVKGQIGRVATPMGAYQVVGTTLNAAKKGLGLTGGERMTPELQDRIGMWIYNNQGPSAWQAWGKGGGAANTSTKGAATMASEEQPMGLLGALGIQKRDPAAGGETALPFYQRDRFANLMDNLAIGFGGMSLDPNEGIIRAAQSRIQNRAEARKAQMDTNKTVQMLQNMGADPKLIELAKAGYAKEAIGLAYVKPKAPEFMEVNGKIVKIDPTTGAATEVFAGGPDAKAVAEARREFTGLKPVKDFADQSVAYSRIIKSIEDPSPSGDLALIFNFMKVLDPGSVVREGEFATAQNAGSVDERVRGLYNRVISGERLTPEQRADFADRATRLYQGGLQEYGALSQQYSAFAKAAGLPVEQVIPSFGYSGRLYSKPLEFQRPPAPPGVPPAEWTAAWSAMTDEERAQFLNGGLQ